MSTSLYFNHLYSSRLFPSHNQQTVRWWRRRRCDQCVSVCVLYQNTEPLSPRNRESDSSAVWQPLLSLWSQHRSGTDLMRCAKSNACFCSLPFVSLSSSSQYSHHPSVFLPLFPIQLPPYFLALSICIILSGCLRETHSNISPGCVRRIYEFGLFWHGQWLCPACPLKHLCRVSWVKIDGCGLCVHEPVHLFVCVCACMVSYSQGFWWCVQQSIVLAGKWSQPLLQPHWLSRHLR